MHEFEFTVAPAEGGGGAEVPPPLLTGPILPPTVALLRGLGISGVVGGAGTSGRLSASSVLASSAGSLVKACPLVSFFAVVGLGEGAHDLEPCESAADGDDEPPPLLAAYEARELQRFPPLDPTAEDVIDGPSLCQFCFPAGVRLRKEGTNLSPVSHAFVMTQQNGDRLYGSCLIFFEPIADGEMLGALSLLEDMYRITHADQGLLPGHLSVKAGRVFAPKCLCIMSRHGFFSAFDTYLRQLHGVGVRRGAPVDPERPIPSPETCLRNLLNDVPTPRRGNALRFFCPTPDGAAIALTVGRPSMRDLPHLDHAFLDLFDLLDLDNVLILFRCLLAERRIVLLTSRPERLVPTAECLLAMMYPFCWCYVYAPVLPRSLLHVLDSPVPYVVGICTDESPRAPSQAPQQQPAPPPQPPNPHLLRLERQASRPSLTSSPSLPREPARHRGSIFEDGSYHDGLGASITMAGGHKFQFPPDAVLVDLDRNNIRVSESIPRLPGAEFRLLVEQLSECLVKARTSRPRPDSAPDWPNRAFRAAFLRFFLNVFRGYAAYVATGRHDTTSSFVPVSGDEDDAPARPPPAAPTATRTSSLEVVRMNSAERGTRGRPGAVSPLPGRRRPASPAPRPASPAPSESTDCLAGAFDSLAFVCDQPEANRPFLTSFLATQTFANFIGEKTHALEGEPQQAVQYFDAIVAGRVEFCADGLTGATVFGESNTFVCPAPAAEPGSREASAGDEDENGDWPRWPHLDRERIAASADYGSVRDGDPAVQKFLSVDSSPGLAVQMRWNSWNNIAQESLERASIPADALGANLTHATRDALLSSLASVVKGLVTCASKASDPLGSSNGSLSSALSAARASSADEPADGAALPMQSDVLVARLCLVMERIWSHGTRAPSAGSASDFWQFLNAVPDPMSQLSAEEMDPRRLRAVCAKEDVWVISRHPALKTDLGRGRAWVRLALEKRRLSDHLGAMLEGNGALIEARFTRDAFLRSREMVEAMLLHLSVLDGLGLTLFSENYVAEPDIDSDMEF